MDGPVRHEHDGDTGVLFGIAPAYPGQKRLERDAETERADDGRIALAGQQRPGGCRARAGDRAAHRRWTVASLLELQRVRLGFQPDGLMTFSLAARSEIPGRERGGVLFGRSNHCGRFRDRDAAISSGCRSAPNYDNADRNGGDRRFPPVPRS
jgi:hypothetical protein